eukprot:6201647-Pleurochrysis_carterae.AAC.10
MKICQNHAYTPRLKRRMSSDLVPARLYNARPRESLIYAHTDYGGCAFFHPSVYSSRRQIA